MLSSNNNDHNNTEREKIVLSIQSRTKSHIYKFASTLKDSLEHGLKREGYVQGVDAVAQTFTLAAAAATSTRRQNFHVRTRYI